MSEQHVIERVWNVPIDQIWALWTTPEGLVSWWNPPGFAVEIDAIELRVGGAFTYTMRAVDPARIAAMEAAGRPTAHTDAATFTEVDPPHRLAYDSPFGDETLHTAVSFTEVDAGVKMVLVIRASKPGMVDGPASGWRSVVDRLEERLAVAS